MTLTWSIIQEHFRSFPLAVPFFALLFAIILKGIVHFFMGRFSFSRMLGSGGMPSAHSTLVVALTTTMGLKHGIESDLFLICLAFSVVIIYDALNVRYQAGLHAKILNDHFHDNTPSKLNESIGHTPIEAFAGGVVGFITAVILIGF